jgi:predicted dehydrogenase
MSTSDTTLRAAIIGTGRIGDTYDDELVHYPDLDLPEDVVHASMYSVWPKSLAASFRTVEGYELVAGANRGRERLEEFGDRHDVSGLYTDYREMLDAEDPDVVAVCTQSPAKHDAVLACADAGVDAVIVEKAFATSLAEADEMIAVCEDAGTRIAVDHPMRFSPMYRRLKELTRDGTIGDLTHLTSHSAGLVHGGSHDFDMLRFLGGDVSSVYARIPELEPGAVEGDPLEGTYEDLDGDVMLTFESGAVGHVECTADTHRGVVVRGTEGYVTAPRGLGGVMNLVQSRRRPLEEFGHGDDSDDPDDSRHDVRWEEALPAWPDSAEADRLSSTQRMLVELSETLVDGASFVSTGQDGAAALEIAIASYHSAIRGEPVDLPLEERDLRVMNR